jgi:hypothetical protein
MDYQEEEMHRTWVQLLIDNGYREVASIAIDTEVNLLSNGYNPYAIALSVPTTLYSTVKNSDQIKKVMERAMLSVCNGRIYDNDGNFVENLSFMYRVRLIKVQEGWQNIVRNLIANAAIRIQ